jgi:hypothetical protein
MVVNGVDESDSARYSGPLPVYELEILESQERWDDECELAADEIWFQEHEAEMRANVARGITF